MEKELDWAVVVAWAQQELEAGFDVFEVVGFSEHEAAVLEWAEKLEILEKMRPARMRRQALSRQAFDMVEIEKAWNVGLSLEELPSESGPYKQMLLVLSRQARRDQVAHDALGSHAAALIADGRPLAPELRRFVIDVLLTNCKRPVRSRGYRPETAYRDRLICWVISTLCEQFELKPTRNDQAKRGNFSACDAVAEAMRALKRRPSTFFRVKEIWMKLGSREQLKQE